MHSASAPFPKPPVPWLSALPSSVYHLQDRGLPRYPEVWAHLPGILSPPSSLWCHLIMRNGYTQVQEALGKNGHHAAYIWGYIMPAQSSLGITTYRGTQKPPACVPCDPPTHLRHSPHWKGPGGMLYPTPWTPKRQMMSAPHLLHPPGHGEGTVETRLQDHCPHQQRPEELVKFLLNPHK